MRETEIRPSIVGRGLLPRSGKLVIGGAPKANKSFVAINMALSIAKGEPLFGARYKNDTPVFPVSGSHRVLYLEQELGDQTLRERLRYVMAPEDVEKLDFYVKTRDMAMRMDTPEGREFIYQEIKDVMPHVVILDPMSKFHLADENSAQEMGAVLRVGDHIVADFETALIYIHHVGKEGGPNAPVKRGGDKLRGSSAIFADVDTFMEVRRLSGPNVKEPILALNFEIRCGEPLEEIHVKRTADGRIHFMGDSFKWGGGPERERRPKYGDL